MRLKAYLVKLVISIQTLLYSLFGYYYDIRLQIFTSPSLVFLGYKSIQFMCCVTNFDSIDDSPINSIVEINV